MNLINAEKEFEKYIEKYDSKNPKIDRKIKHSYRVIDVAEDIAKSLELTEENITLAKLIALLHDIGRFEQIKIYNTFSDKDSIDHADFGVKVLFEDNLIRNFIKEDRFDNIIYKSIKNHNKYKIEEGLSERELLHTKIIRDADKTDIFEVYIREIESNEDAIFNFNELPKQKISEKVLEAVKENRLVNSFDTVTEIDKYIRALAFIFDFNYKEGLEIVKNKKYIDRLINRIRTDENSKILNFINNTINKYIDKRLSE